MTQIDVARLPVGTTILIETANNVVFQFKVVAPEQRLVEVTGTLAVFRDKGPITGELVESGEPVINGKTVPGVLAKGWVFSLRFANAVLVSDPVESALVQGDGWKYEAFA